MHSMADQEDTNGKGETQRFDYIKEEGTRTNLIEDPSVARGLTVFTAALFVSGQVGGGGTVAVANAFANMGWIGVVVMAFSIFGNGFIAIILSKSFLLLEEREEHFRTHIRDAYTTLMHKTLGRKGKVISSVVFHTFFISAATVYLLISSELVSNVVHLFHKGFLGHNDVRVYVVAFAAIIIPLSFFGTPKEFWGIALLATTSTGVSVLLMIIRLILQDTKGMNTTEVPKRMVTWRSFFSGLGTIVFSFAGVPLFPALFFDMKARKDFPKAVVTGYSFIVLFYFPLSIYVYLLLGDNIKPNLLTTLLELKEPCQGCQSLVHIAQFLLGVHFVFGYLLICNPMMQELEEYLGTPKYFSWQRCLLRSLLVLLTVVLAETIPHFDVILSLTGGTLMTILTYILPVLAYYRLQKDMSLHMKVLLFELLGVGCICCVGSVYAAVMRVSEIY